MAPSRRTVLSSLAAGFGIMGGCSKNTSQNTTSDQPGSRTHPPSSTQTQTKKCLPKWNPEPLWSFEASSPLSNPVIYDNKIYISGQEGRLYALESETGTTIWTADTRSSTRVSAVLNKNIIATNFNRIVVYKAASGEQVWEFSPPGENSQIDTPAVRTNQVICTSASRMPTPSIDVDNPYSRLYGIKPENGRVQWETRLKTNQGWTPATGISASENRILVATESGDLFAFNPENGTNVWRKSLGNLESLRDPPLVRNNTVYQIVHATPAKKDLVALSAETGQIQWQINGCKRKPAYSKGTIYCQSSNTLKSISAEDGSLEWSDKIEGIVGTPTVSNGYLFLRIGNDKLGGELSGYNPHSNCLMGSFQVESKFPTQPAVSYGIIYFGAGEKMHAVSSP